ncbi:hypothetical protein ACT3UD_09500 [Glutamicibacter sp. 287]|uniref:hypothetical protein n=1 Tax=unclassified Glutamicibacter TaxID=2627139 RepID=UPI0020D17D17|nr:hypothetical protein [Glutamicibacter sp. BW80]
MNAETDLSWKNSTLESADAVDVARRLKNESSMPLRSHGSLSMNRADGCGTGGFSAAHPLPGDYRNYRT